MSAIAERRRVMPQQERERIAREVKEEQRDMAGDFKEVSRAGKKFLMTRPDAGKLRNNQKVIDRKLKALRDGDPGSLSKIEKARLEKRKAELLEKCRKRMVPQEDVRLTPSEKGASNPDFSKAVNFMAKGEHSQDYLRDAHELKNILRRLDPEDPQAGNLERYRPKRGEVI